MKKGWKATTLGSEIDLLAGFAFKSQEYTDTDMDIRLLRGDNIVQGCLRWDDVKRWPATDIESYERYQLQEGDVVLAMDRPWVKAGLKHATMTADDLPCLLVQRTARLRAGVNLTNRYLMYLLGSGAFTGHILGVQTGIGVPHISGQQIKDFAFARPPLAEQQRIVGILDEAFEGIATAKANAEKNLPNARALFESHLTEALSSVGKNWPSRQLDSLLIGERKISYGIVKPGIHDPHGVRLIKSQQVRDNSMDLTQDFRITKKLDQEYARTRLHGGEILLNLVGASIGRSAFAPAELKGANVSRAIAVIPVRHEAGRWVQYNLRCSVGQTLIQAKTGGSAQPVLNLSEVKSLAVPFPPVIEQEVIVQKLDALVTAVQRLATIYERKFAALDDLKKSLLHQAFSGEL